MARGRYGARAALRRESAEVTTTIEDYKRAVVKLTQERDDLAEQLAKEREARSKERRSLRAMLDEGLAPELTARDKVIASLRQRLGEQRSFDLGVKLANDKLWTLLRRALAEQGLHGDAVLAWVTKADPTFHPAAAEAERKLVQARHVVAAVADGAS